jgi:hypothetical protein
MPNAFGPRSRAALPPTVVLQEELNWQGRANCRNRGDEFSVPDGMNGKAKKAFIDNARAICHGCPVFFECQDYAQDRTWHDIVVAGVYHPQ